MVFLVARRDSLRPRLDPDLQEVHQFTARRIELAVPYPGAGAHALHVPGPDRRTVAERILVRQRALEHVADDLHGTMALRAEALAGLHAVLVDHAQRAEAHVLR